MNQITPPSGWTDHPSGLSFFHINLVFCLSKRGWKQWQDDKTIDEITAEISIVIAMAGKDRSRSVDEDEDEDQISIFDYIAAKPFLRENNHEPA